MDEPFRVCPTLSVMPHVKWAGIVERPALTTLTATPNPVQIATEGALWGSIRAHRFLSDAVIVSDATVDPASACARM